MATPLDVDLAIREIQLLERQLQNGADPAGLSRARQAAEAIRGVMPRLKWRSRKGAAQVAKHLEGIMR